METANKLTNDEIFELIKKIEPLVAGYNFRDIATAFNIIKTDLYSTRGEFWVIEFDNDGKKLWFQRYLNGKISESMRPCSKEEAIIWFIQAVYGSSLSRVPLHPREPTG